MGFFFQEIVLPFSPSQVAIQTCLQQLAESHIFGIGGYPFRFYAIILDSCDLSCHINVEVVVESHENDLDVIVVIFDALCNHIGKNFFRFLNVLFLLLLCQPYLHNVLLIFLVCLFELYAHVLPSSLLLF